MHQIFKAFLLFLLFSTSANAEYINAKYAADWNGLEVGSMAIVASENQNKYEYQALIQSEGLLKTFTKYHSENISKGTIGANGKIIPQNYNTQWVRKKEVQSIDVTYKDEGKTAQENATPPEKRPKRPIVPPEYKNNTLDPVSAAFSARSQIKKIVESDTNFPQKITIPVFDARRRFDVELTINGYKKKKIDGKSMNLLEVIFFRRPINGFNDKELKRMQQQDPTITFYLNDNYIPVLGSGEAPFGKANFRLVSLCQSIELACK